MRTMIFLAIFIAVSAGMDAEEPLDKPILSEGTHGKPEAKPKTLQLMLVKEVGDNATTRFTSDSSKIRAAWKGRGLEAGDQIQVVWLAEDVGIDAPKDSKITEAAVTAYKPDDDGVFALAQPKGGWPLGKYRCEVYLNGKLMQTIDFTIEKGAVIELGQDGK